MELISRKRSMKKLPAKYAAWVLPLILSFFMSGTLSFANMWMSIGFIPEFLSKWSATWMFSWLIAYPLVMFLLPIVRRLTGLIVDMKTH
ncbi:DUF2798 domain-containing protein [Acinetobacter sp. C26M]|uniref:DUF2798 domain-containing protein n=2 Tax=Acinetobacter TaxID=469 RepID=UPI00148FF3D8|nr:MULTISPECIES: DUF2798 domain-containing protein [unclassified Acinetobacter]NIE98035.1 DUF2798 domain-containing protein [Acinetobacter sp. Tr-809]USA48364.1 DUF2798 domain-containing protein [Acinetobacter sp. C26M]USA51852.1 DUF2798 domain-containing protein [Acinetobacter sp. C26G]